MTPSEDYAGRERRRNPRHSTVERALGPFYGLLRWIDRNVRGFHAALGAYLVIGLVLALGAILVFAAMAELMAEGVTQRVDNAVLLWLNEHASETLDVLALEVTALGGGGTVWMVVAVGSVFLWTSRHRYSAALLWVAVVGAGILNAALKTSFDRPRPQLFEWRTDYAGLSSFPSGHAMTAMVVYATLAYLVVRLEPSRRLRRLTLGVAAVVILLIGLSRMYLGVHYPSDVLAGYVAGLAWATACALGIEAVRYFRSKRPEVGFAEEDLEQGTRPIRDAVEAHPRG